MKKRAKYTQFGGRKKKGKGGGGKSKELHSPQKETILNHRINQ